MIKCKVIKDFSLKKFDELKNLERYNKVKKENGQLYENDTFECTKEMAEYLTGNNPVNEVVVEIIEVEPVKEEKKKNDVIENEFEIRSEEVKELVDERIKEAEEIIKPKSNKKKKKK